MSGSDQTYIRELEAGDVGCRFKCGEHALDHFFKRYAYPNHEVGDCKAYVLAQDADPRVIGFYTISPCTVESALVAERLAPWGAPGRALPAFLLGRLAVQTAYQKRGFGPRLLHHALTQAERASRVVAGVGLIVDAKNEKAVKFYADFGLSLLDGENYPRRMFIRMTDLRAAIAASFATT